MEQFPRQRTVHHAKQEKNPMISPRADVIDEFIVEEDEEVMEFLTEYEDDADFKDTVVDTAVADKSDSAVLDTARIGKRDIIALS